MTELEKIVIDAQSTQIDAQFDGFKRPQHRLRPHLGKLDEEIAGRVGDLGPVAAESPAPAPRPGGKCKQTGKNIIALDFRKEGFRYCRRMKGKLGKAEGITATAHKLARVPDAMIANGRGYDEAEAFQKKPYSITIT